MKKNRGTVLHGLECTSVYKFIRGAGGQCVETNCAEFLPTCYLHPRPIQYVGSHLQSKFEVRPIYYVR